MSAVDGDRLALGSAAVVSVERASELLPIARGRARQWLHDRGLVVQLAGRPVVVWGDVLEALRAEHTRPKRRPRPAAAPLPVAVDPD